MVLDCQLASSLAAVLLVIPMFYLGRELFDRRVGFWSAALFECLPVTARITSDALSEATFLLFITGLLFLGGTGTARLSGAAVRPLWPVWRPGLLDATGRPVWPWRPQVSFY